MSGGTINPLVENDADKVAAQEATRRTEVGEFVRTSPDYYADQFKQIGADAKFTPTFNLLAGLFGPIWFGARGLWKWAVAFLIVETFAFVQLSRGLFGDLAADARNRVESIQGTLELRKRQLEAAIENNSDRIDPLKRTVESLEGVIEGYHTEAQAMESQGIWIALIGLVVLIVAKAVQSVVANSVLEGRFSEWLSDNSLPSGLPISHIILSSLFCVLIAATAMVHYSFPGVFPILTEFPTEGGIRLTAVQAVEDYPGRFAIMHAVPWNEAEALPLLERWRETPGMLGIRYTFLEPGQREALESGALDWLWAASTWLPVALVSRAQRWMPASTTPRCGRPSASRLALIRLFRSSWPTWPPKWKPHAC